MQKGNTNLLHASALGARKAGPASRAPPRNSVKAMYKIVADNNTIILQGFLFVNKKFAECNFFVLFLENPLLILFFYCIILLG